MKQVIIQYSYLFTFLLFVNISFAQMSKQDNDTIEEMFYISPSYAAQVPLGDMKNDFGFSSMVGLSFNFKSHKNWTYGLEYNYLFGNNVKDEFAIYSGIITDQGFFLNLNGDFSDVKIQERGNSLMLNVGKVIPLFGINQNTGIQVKFGAGFLRHRIKAYVQFDDVPQLAGDYKKYYDRLSSGITLSQFIGYTHFGSSRLINFYGGLEIYEAFTIGRRDYQADLMAPYHDSRLDILVGAKIGWMIPFRRRKVSEYYFF